MESRWKKVFAHVDMDAFFASVEQLLHEEWRGKPVIVGADPREGRGRGVVSAASYEARKFGVHSAMPISKAYRLCPHAIFARPHGHSYQEFSKKIFTILRTYSPRVQPLSIDEAFLDLTGCIQLHGSIENAGRNIKNDILKNTGLTASVGIAPVKSVAKIASDLDKPDGLTIVYPEKMQEVLDQLPVSRLWGVGKKLQDSLKGMGIQTVGQLRRYPSEVLEKKFGKMGIHVHKMARGEDNREVEIEEAVKSVSNEVTFGKDCEDIETVRETVFTLAEKVGGRLRRGGIRGKTVHLKIRFQDFKTFTRSLTLSNPTHLTDEIYQAVNMLLAEFDPPVLAIRLVGVGVSNLVVEEGIQLSLWDLDNQKKLKMEKVMDQIQDKFGKNSIGHAISMASKKKYREHDDW